MFLLKPLAAGLGAAGLAFGLNWLVLRRVGRRGLWLVVPAVEEFLKSGTALLVGASLPLAHAAFGLVEAGYELRGPAPSPVAAGLALATHAALGLLTALLAARSGGLGPAVLASATLHATFNLAVTERSPRPGPGSGEVS